MRGGVLLKQFTDLESISNLDMWQRCYTAEEIGDAVGLKQAWIQELLSAFTDLELPINLSENEAKRHPVKTENVQLAKYQDDEFQPPIYNVWASNHQSIPKRNNLSATRFQ